MNQVGMKVIMFGATGMVGQGVLRECLLDPGIESVLEIPLHACACAGMTVETHQIAANFTLLP